MTMHEIQEAAKVITESVDPEARIIFGAIKDTKLKKDEVKVTVIASGFPESDIADSSLFGSTVTEKKEDPSPKKEVKREPSREIHNSVEPHHPTIKSAPAQDEDEDDWNAIPAFLRRKK
jgi:cell division protein FtsZ